MPRPTVPTATFRALYVVFVVRHTRRVLRHFRLTSHSTAAWITQQLREAFPYDQAPRYLILDRDAKYGNEVLAGIHHIGIEPKQITARSPWQNGDVATNRPLDFGMATYIDDPKDAVVLAVTVDAKTKELTVTVTNSGYRKAN